MKILKLTAENVKKLRAITIEPDPKGNLVIVGGKNAAGKSSVLDSIAMVIGGASEMPARPIRDGEDEAQVLMETEEFTALLKIKQTGKTLTIKNKEGVPARSPQALLDSLTAKVCFDPLEFTKMKPAEQSETLRRLVGLDFTELDREEAEKYALRTGVNRSVKEQRDTVARLGPPTDAGCEYLEAGPIAGRMEAGAAVNAANEKKRSVLDDANDAIADCESGIAKQAQLVDRLKAELAAASDELARRQDERAAFVKTRDHVHKEISGLVDVDLSLIRQEMEKLNAHNEEVRENLKRKEQAAKLRALEKEAKDLSDRLTGIEQERARQLRKAKFPIEGLSFMGVGVTYNSVPFEQASAAEQLRVSVAMGAAMQPKLKVALIRDGSLLDDDSLKLVAETAEKYGVQVWLERVGEGKECSVIIEDGEVKERA